MLLTSNQIKKAEEIILTTGATAATLMEIAGQGIADCVEQFFIKPSTAVVYCGIGNNGGDVLVVGLHLLKKGWKILIRLAGDESRLSEFIRQQLCSLKREGAQVLESCPVLLRGQLVILDGLLGIGSTGSPRGKVLDLIDEMNAMRRDQGGCTVAIDIPSGLSVTDGIVEKVCVQADFTITIGAVKTALIADTATPYVGRLACIPLPGIGADQIPAYDPASISTATMLRSYLPVRNFDTHKGTYGRIGILAGTCGFFGAARLCAAGALVAGAGLVTLYATPDSYDFLATTCMPEIMVQRVLSYSDIADTNNDVLVIGPGLGHQHEADILEVMSHAKIPCVIDADALNALAKEIARLSQCAGPRLLTPHPGEMQRLHQQGSRNRRLWAEDFVHTYPVTLLLKGSRTIIAQDNLPSVFNSTGNPGMATGGMGDVLAGVCGALIGGGNSLFHAAILGAWLCGRSAEIAMCKCIESQESLLPTSVIEHIGESFLSLRRGDF